MTGFVIPGRLPGLNEYTTACRTNPHKGAKMKRDAQEFIEYAIIKAQHRGELPRRFRTPVRLVYTFYEPNKRRDKDNIASFAHKVIQDALVHLHLLDNDGWGDVYGWTDEFGVDRRCPRIEVMIEEAGDNGAGV